jgi:hypothetical protein
LIYNENLILSEGYDCPIVDDSEKKYCGAQIQPAAVGDLNEISVGFCEKIRS